MDFKYEVKVLLNETLAKKILTTQTGEKIERTAGQAEREVHKNAVEKLMQAAKGVGDGNYDIQSTWLQEGDDDKSIDDFIKHPKKLMVGNTQAIDIIRGRLSDDKDRKKFDEIVKWAKNGGEKAMVDLIKVAKGMLADSIADKKALAAGDEQVRKDILDKGIENLEIIYNAAIQRNRLGKEAGKAQVVELQTDKPANKIELTDFLRKEGDKYTVKNERLVEKILRITKKSRKEFDADLVEFNKVIGKKGTKRKEIETVGGEKVVVPLRAEDLKNEFINKYVESLKDYAEKGAVKERKYFENKEKAKIVKMPKLSLSQQAKKIAGKLEKK